MVTFAQKILTDAPWLGCSLCGFSPDKISYKICNMTCSLSLARNTVLEALPPVRYSLTFGCYQPETANKDGQKMHEIKTGNYNKVNSLPPGSCVVSAGRGGRRKSFSPSYLGG